MNRYKKCTIKVNKEVVKREVVYKYGSIINYCRHAGISKMRFWQIVNTPHLTKEVECLQRLTRDLGLSIKQILM